MNANQKVYDEELEWADIQAIIQNSVVQVISQTATFNWAEPYRISEQQEVRGTGFFIDQDGHIITNAHVVDQAKTIWIHVPMLGKTLLFANVVSFCPDRDIALLRIDEQSRDFLKKELGFIVPLQLGDSDMVQSTDTVFVFGYPLGQYGLKGTMGIVSGRESDEGRTLIQITAPINPGNSGGPLFNEKGEVIGIAIYMVPLAQNIGYVIPINELKTILEDMYRQRFVRNGVLGIQFNYASDEYAQLLNNPLPAGCYINKVYAGSLLEKAGVCEGDMIYELNTFRLDSFGEVIVPWSQDKISIHDLVSRLKIGDTINLVLYRNGVGHALSFVFEMVPPYPIRFIYPAYEEVRYEIVGGMVVMQLADNHLVSLATLVPSLVRYIEVENKVEPRLIITHVFAGSVIQQSRCFEPGDILTHVNGIPVKTLDDFAKAFFLPLKNKFFTMKTDDAVFGVFSLEKMKQDEKRLSRDFAYPLSRIGKALIGEK